MTYPGFSSTNRAKKCCIVKQIPLKNTLERPFFTPERAEHPDFTPTETRYKLGEFRGFHSIETAIRAFRGCHFKNETLFQL